MITQKLSERMQIGLLLGVAALPARGLEAQQSSVAKPNLPWVEPVRASREPSLEESLAAARAAGAVSAAPQELRLLSTVPNEGAFWHDLRLPAPDNASHSTEATFRRLMEQPSSATPIDGWCRSDPSAVVPQHLTDAQSRVLGQRLRESSLVFQGVSGTCEEPVYHYNSPAGDPAWNSFSLRTGADSTLQISSAQGIGTLPVADASSFGLRGSYDHELHNGKSTLVPGWGYQGTWSRDLIPVKECQETVYLAGNTWQNCYGGSLLNLQGSAEIGSSGFGIGASITGPTLYGESRYSTTPDYGPFGWTQSNYTIRTEIGPGFGVNLSEYGSGFRSGWFGGSFRYDLTPLGEN